ncbi:MAG: hypothetical protein GVY04_23075 [Cyanobacteria bacterium]|nr:hypothetical protein [Cyanobacteria bacterium GSL.Bin1]
METRICAIAHFLTRSRSQSHRELNETAMPAYGAGLTPYGSVCHLRAFSHLDRAFQCNRIDG